MVALRIALIADVFPPLRSSGAVQLRDLAFELRRQGHDPCVLVTSPELETGWRIESWQGLQVVRLRAPGTKDMGYVRRTLGELRMPYAMMRNLRLSPLASQRWDGVVWYSPSIFLGPMAKALKTSSVCRSYLIVRDLFPDWAVDMGLMGRGFSYRMFKAVESFQYSVADVIGVQSPANLRYFGKWAEKPERRLEVLQNWLADAPNTGCSVRIANSALAGRKVFVYAGNMGVAQGTEVLLGLAQRLQPRQDMGMIFVGRGSKVQGLRARATAMGLDNVAFFDEIEPAEIPGLYAQCHVGVVTLDPRHSTQNIPGKFLSYLRAGLPVLASVNAGNDLARLIDGERVGRVCTDGSADTLYRLAIAMVDGLPAGAGIQDRCKALCERLFSPEVAARQIVRALLP
ncbi:MAG: glycosyltransferase family 4 protein [Burkholderiaceae bacterium]